MRKFKPLTLAVVRRAVARSAGLAPAEPRYIQSVWGVGYVFVPDGAT